MLALMSVLALLVGVGVVVLAIDMVVAVTKGSEVIRTAEGYVEVAL